MVPFSRYILLVYSSVVLFSSSPGMRPPCLFLRKWSDPNSDHCTEGWFNGHVFVFPIGAHASMLYASYVLLALSLRRTDP